MNLLIGVLLPGDRSYTLAFLFAIPTKHTPICAILVQTNSVQSILPKTSANVDSNRLAEILNSLESTFMKNRGVEGSHR